MGLEAGAEERQEAVGGDADVEDVADEEVGAPEEAAPHGVELRRDDRRHLPGGQQPQRRATGALRDDKEGTGRIYFPWFCGFKNSGGVQINLLRANLSENFCGCNMRSYFCL